jgi:hypothetical protein
VFDRQDQRGCIIFKLIRSSLLTFIKYDYPIEEIVITYIEDLAKCAQTGPSCAAITTAGQSGSSQG